MKYDDHPEYREMRDHCNAVWHLVRNLLPFCPAKAKAMIDKAMEEGRALAAARKKEMCDNCRRGEKI